MVEKTSNPKFRTGLPNLLLTASGPGEINGCVRPLLKEIRRQEKNWRVSLVLWKTSFSTGSERRIASLLPGLDQVVSLRSTTRAVADRLGLSRLRQIGMPRALVHMGGEPLKSRLLAMRLGCPAFLYSEQGVTLRSLAFKKVFLSASADTASYRNAACSKGRYCRVGNLFVDTVVSGDLKIENRSPIPENGKISIGLFPGSRPYQIRQLGPLLLALSRRIAEKLPDVEFLFSKSEYLSLESFVRLVAGRKDASLDKDNRLRVHHRAKSPFGPAKEFPIPIRSSQEVFTQSDLVVMLPGTATAEGMLMAVPMIVLAPYYRLGSNPAPIVPDVVDTVLGKMGKCIKQKALLMVLERVPFFSHPNICAGREIVPELRGWIKPSEIVQTVVEMAQKSDWRKRIKQDLKGLAGPAGAAERILEILTPIME